MKRITLESVMGTISFICGIIGILSLDGYTYFNQSIVPALILLLISGTAGYIALKEGGYIRKRKPSTAGQAKSRESTKIGA
jgi:hypothetical protein